MAAVMESVENDENLLRTLFRQSFPETWRDSADFASYLAELSASSLDRLGREPERLAEEKAQILEQTEHLAFHNYTTFIKAAECSKEIFKDFVSVEKHVKSLLDKLPAFSETCSKFMDEAQAINSSRRLNSLTLQRHTQLLEILEISQLMDTCVRNGYYEEALELASYVHRLEKKLSTIPVIQNIVEEVQSSTKLMLSQLLQQLRSAIQLPACLRVIGYLRRLDVFSESELRIKFLQARDAWLQSVLSSIPSDDPYYHITKTIETSRVSLFDIVTQYRAIFSDDDPILTMENEESPVYSNLFHCWIVQKVHQFLKTLEYDLNCGVGSRLDSLLGQCMYFGLSFSRVGADFRGLLPPLFQAAAVQSLQSALQDATSRFIETMKSYSLQPVSATLTSTMLTSPSMMDETNQVLCPPVVLLQYPPLAMYINNILTALNDLRHCAPLSLVKPLTDALQSSLDSVVDITCSFHRTEAAALSEEERTTFANFCQVLGRDLVPYINCCIEAIYPKHVLTTVLGSSSLEDIASNRSGNKPLRVDEKRIVSQLEPLMPQETKTVESKVDDTVTSQALHEADKSISDEKPKTQTETEVSSSVNEQTEPLVKGDKQDELPVGTKEKVET